ncbi:MAG TPA: DUF5719 family protein [Acidimicrobiales bacterium]
MRHRRFVALGVLALVLVAAAWADRDPEARPVPAFAEQTPYVMPVAAPPSALTTAWYCAGAGSKEDGLAEGTVVVANAGDEAVRASVTVFPAGGEPETSALDVPAHGRASASLVDLVDATSTSDATYAAALVEAPGGEVAAELSVRGPNGTDTTPCSSGPSDRWYFAWGVTTVDAKERLLLFNPFPADATADVSAATDDGRRDPEALQGLVVPGRSMVVVEVNEHVLREPHLALTVATRSGQLVVNRVQERDGEGGPRGLAVTLGAPALGERWWFPAGYVADGVGERLHVYNPGDEEAEVDVLVTLDDPATNGVPAPFELSIPAEDWVTLDLNEEERIPAEVPHAITVESVNGVPVVAERVVNDESPSARTGISAELGSRLAAERWVLPAGAATEETDELVTVFNPSDRAATLSVVPLDGSRSPEPIVDLAAVELAAGERIGLRLGDFVQAEQLPVVVESTEPVVVERRIAAIDDLGVAATMAIPLSG